MAGQWSQWLGLRRYVEVDTLVLNKNIEAVILKNVGNQNDGCISCFGSLAAGRGTRGIKNGCYLVTAVRRYCSTSIKAK